MTTPGTICVVPHKPWLSQGDIFTQVLIPRVGVRDGLPAAAVERGPAMLITHGCTLDKKNGRGLSILEHLTFVPLQSVAALPEDRAGDLRARAAALAPYSILYVGQVEAVGEAYATLHQPYTLPAVLAAEVLTPLSLQ